MASSKNGGWSFVFGRWLEGVIALQADFSPKPRSDEEDGRVSRYRTSWDAHATATLPDSGAGTPESAASTRAGANWKFGCASEVIPRLL
jgi:hypothetical protein